MPDNTDVPQDSMNNTTASHIDAPQQSIPPQQSSQGMELPNPVLHPGAPPLGGYPPPIGPQPQQGYPPQFMGNMPPGYAPLPFYAMPMEFPPPPAYAVPPPYPGYPWEIIAPASGDLLQTWFTIATNFSRRTIAAGAQAMQQNSAVWSIVVGTILSTLAGIVNGMKLLDFTNPTAVFTSGTQQAQTLQISQDALRIEGVTTLIITPIFFVAEVLLLPWFWSFFMTPYLGTPRQRFLRALKPLALIQPIVGSVALIEALLFLAIYVYAPAYGPLATIFALPLVIYTQSLVIQSGAVGAGLKRWPVFGISLLAYLAIGFVALILVIVGLALFFLTH